MKTCSICKLDKSRSEFHVRMAAKDGLQSRCKLCSNAARMKSYRKNPEIQRANERKREAANIAKAIEYKELHPCKHCGEKNPIVLDFHHTRDKIHTISFMIHSGYSWKNIIKEIDKCIILCANCHRKEHNKGL